MKKWVQLSIVGVAMLGLAGCRPKQVSFDKTHQYQLTDSIGHGCYDDLLEVFKGKTSKNVTVIAYSKESDDMIKTKSDKHGRFTLKLPADETAYTITAENKKSKSDVTKVKTKYGPDDSYLELDLDSNSKSGNFVLHPDANGKGTVTGEASPNVKIVAQINDGEYHTLASTKSDKKGRFTLHVTGLTDSEEDGLFVATNEKGKVNNFDTADIKYDTTAKVESEKKPESDKKSESDTKENTATSQAKNYDPIDYETLSRNPKEYSFKKLQITGTVLQTIENKKYNDAVIEMDGNSDHVVVVNYGSKSTQNGERLLEGDNITVNGYGMETASYETVSGTKVTAPDVYASKITRN
ncbi:hypothetical protein [Loigolactobacillus bifermentans]|uniref:Lipoprotein n=1 Tax=Loigolactobacillus bifermentans DSM 20003 TaxID=1423726 RepID=A0A0R1GKC2_9LACO|nr:hypothetical protein [Loigolactobacillus bifermentans]KRK34540.1 hypothetical protein FC07_GL000554 [Loigolactobacillus bifermentans DSM 20003]QGG61316.1 hypothetical protein LB003_13035 [Loigolactobacillus bifermentans]